MNIPGCEDGISEIIGAVLLISVVVLGLSIAGVVILSTPPPQKIPTISADITRIGNTIYIRHEGGNTLQFTDMHIVLDGVDETGNFTTSGSSSGSTWTSFAVGDTLQYTVPYDQSIPNNIGLVFVGGSADQVMTSLEVPTSAVTVLTGPIISGITPASALTGTTASVTNLAGTRFLSGATVKLTKSGSADIPATSVTVGSSNQISCQFNLAGATTGTWNVVVTNTDTQSGTLTNGFTVMDPAPTVTAITPASASTGTTVSITNLAGTGFLTGATVKLTKSGSADIPATSVTVGSSNQISCQFNVAGATTGTWNVVVTNMDAQSGILTNGFTVMNPAPTVTAITPSSANRGWPVSITNLAGTGFSSGATVKLTRTGQPDVVATSVTVVSSTKITCQFNLAGAGSGAGQWNVVATNTDGLSGTLTNGFTVNSPAPSYTNVNPANGDRGWPVSVTLTGANFQPGATVSMTMSGQTPVNAYNVVGVSSTQITCTFNLLGVTAGNWNIGMTNSDGQSSNTHSFAVQTSNPTVGTLSPNSGKHGTTGLTITDNSANHLQPGMTVVLTKSPTTITAYNVNVNSPTSVTFTIDIPAGATTGYYNVKYTNTDSTTGNSNYEFTVTT